MMKKLRFLLTVILTVALGINAFAQNSSQIKGSVLDSDKMPVPGAFVKLVGTTTGTSTDSQGQFSIQAKPGDKLEFTCIGYLSQTITIVGGVGN